MWAWLSKTNWMHPCLVLTYYYVLNLCHTASCSCQTLTYRCLWQLAFKFQGNRSSLFNAFQKMVKKCLQKEWSSAKLCNYHGHFNNHPHDNNNNTRRTKLQLSSCLIGEAYSGIKNLHKRAGHGPQSSSFALARNLEPGDICRKQHSSSPGCVCDRYRRQCVWDPFHQDVLSVHKCQFLSWIHVK